MLNDVVVDTNVWMHADDPSTKHFEDALLFVATLNASSTRLCLDGRRTEEGKLVDSRILGEYRRKLLEHSQGTPAKVLSGMLSSGRFRRVSLKTTDFARKWSEQHIAKNTDRPFLIAAINSKSRVLVSHDESDFDVVTRTAAKRHFKVVVCLAEAVIQDLA